METIDFRPHLVLAEIKVPEHIFKHYRDKDEYLKYVRTELAQRIGELIEKEARYKTWYDPNEGVHKFRLSLYAIPQDKLIEMLDADKVVKPHIEPLKICQMSDVPTNATDALVNIYSEAYDISFCNPDDTEIPERRGLQAVFDYLRSKS